MNIGFVEKNHSKEELDSVSDLLEFSNPRQCVVRIDVSKTDLEFIDRVCRHIERSVDKCCEGDLEKLVVPLFDYFDAFYEGHSHLYEGNKKAFYRCASIGFLQSGLSPVVDKNTRKLFLSGKNYKLPKFYMLNVE